MKIKVMVTIILLILPCLSWRLFNSYHSPWWLENTFSSPLIIIVFCLLLQLLIIRLLPLTITVWALMVNMVLAIYLDSSAELDQGRCANPVKLFQFNVKFNEKHHELIGLVNYLKTQQYHLIALQGVSLSSKRLLINKLSPYFPYFINSNTMKNHAHSDQLIFSRYAFSQVKNYKDDQHTFLIASQWQLPEHAINLYALHPPSPRTELLWGIRNKTLYQLAYALDSSPEQQAVVIGDLNISKHSPRVNTLFKNMKTLHVNSWPKSQFIPAEIGFAIDHLWVTKHYKLCYRSRINAFDWSDHYPIESHINTR